jgi:putative FmdB family regulatory protein
MPIYDYTCSACGHLTEVLHGIHDHGPRFCPECGAEGTMVKGFATPTIHFKGTGWAKKDRSTSSKAPTKAKRDESTSDSAATSARDSTGDDAGSGGTSSSSSGEASSGSSTPASGTSD